MFYHHMYKMPIFFSNVEDMNRFTSYWRHTKNVKNISAILFEDENHIIRTFNSEVKK